MNLSWTPMKGLVALYGSEEVVRNRICKVSRADLLNAFHRQVYSFDSIGYIAKKGNTRIISTRSLRRSSVRYVIAKQRLILIPSVGISTPMVARIRAESSTL